MKSNYIILGSDFSTGKTDEIAEYMIVVSQAQVLTYLFYSLFPYFSKRSLKERLLHHH